MSFRLFDLNTAGTQAGTSQIIENVPVTNGIFTVELNFDIASFVRGAAKYLEIAVRPGDRGPLRRNAENIHLEPKTRHLTDKRGTYAYI